MAESLPVLWLCGAPATGKSTVAWQLFTDLGAEREHIAYVDIDQLGMLYPAPEEDPDRVRTKAKNLAAVIRGYRAAGSRALIVSGVLDPAAAPTFVESCAGLGNITLCHLTVDEPTLRARLSERGWPEEAGDASLADMRALTDSTCVDVTVDTSGRTVPEIVADVRPLLSRLPEGPASPAPDAPAPEVPVSVICGPRAVGKSSVSWSMFVESVHSGTRTGYVDLEQVSFLHPLTDVTSGLKAGNVAGLVETFSTHGAQHVIVNGMVDAQTAAALRGLGNVRIVRLRADEEQLRARIDARFLGDGGARLAGDDLEGATERHQAAVLASAVEQDLAYDEAPFEDLLVDTRRDPQCISDHIRQRAH
jgi:hypothetical protein